jgi:hypothetical protein
VLVADVEYSVEERDAYLNNLLAAAFRRYLDLVERYRSSGEKPDSDLRFESMMPMFDDLHQQSHRFKLPAFSEEKEVRLVVHIASSDELIKRVRVRTRASGLVPYIVLKPRSGPLPLRKVITGPAYSSAMANYSLKALLSQCGYEPVDIEPSKYFLR